MNKEPRELHHDELRVEAAIIEQLGSPHFVIMNEVQFNEMLNQVIDQAVTSIMPKNHMDLVDQVMIEPRYEGPNCIKGDENKEQRLYHINHRFNEAIHELQSIYFELNELAEYSCTSVHETN